MAIYIVVGLLVIHCIYLHGQINKLKYSAKYGSSQSENNIRQLWSMSEEAKEKLGEHNSRLWELEHKAGMHPPRVNI